MALQLELVGNPAAGEPARGEDGGLELVVLPPQLRRVGALLSTTDGAPTPLCTAGLAVLSILPLYAPLIGLPGAGGNVFDAAAARDTAYVAFDLGIVLLGFLLPGPIALHTLRLATKHPDGLLDRLGAGRALVPRSTLSSLRWWRRVLKVLLFFIMAVWLFMFAGLAASGKPGVGVPFAIHAVFFWPALFGWLHTLKVAAALVATPVADARRKARAEAERVRESGGAMNPERWATEIEEPVRQLARSVLPALSAGWGLSVGLVAAGLISFAMSLAVFLDGVGALSSGSIGAQVAVAGMIAGLAVLPFLVALDPANASSGCARLEDDINHLCVEDPSFVRADNFVKSLKRLNRGQGLGFTVFGSVTTKRTLWLVCTGIYGGLAAFGPTLLGELGMGGQVPGQHSSCPFGWTFAEDACYKLLGDGLLHKPLPWSEAEASCQQQGPDSHLASVTGAEQQQVVQDLAGSTGDNTWIGLNDIAEEGEFTWADDEPLEFTNWSPGQPNNAAPGGGEEDAAVLGNNGAWADRAVQNPYPYICVKPAAPQVASGGDMLGCADGHWVLGTAYRQSVSMPALPRTIAPGVFKARIYEEIVPRKHQLNATTPAECATLVQHRYPDATAAEYSNVSSRNVAPNQC